MELEQLKKRKGIITINYCNNKENPFSVDFDGWNEGSGSPCKDEQGVKEQVENLIKRHSEKYTLKIIDKRGEKETETKIIPQREQLVNIEIQKAEQQIQERIIKDFKMEEEFKIPMEYTRSLARGFHDSFILFGKQGQGKTTIVLKTLEEEKANYVYHSGISTPKALYEFLYENREGKVIVFDDCAGLINNLYALSILLSALWSSVGKRVITWNSTKSTIPRFIFNSRIIVIANKLPKTDYADVVLSRCLVYNLNLTYSQIINMMYAIGNEEIVDYIRENSSEATKHFDLRLLKKAEKFYEYNQDGWKELIKPMLERDEDLQLILSGLDYTRWCEKTQLSKRTYERYKHQLGLTRSYPIRQFATKS